MPEPAEFVDHERHQDVGRDRQPCKRASADFIDEQQAGNDREGADQTAYEPLFRQASDIMAQYRQALGLRGAFRSDIAWLTGASPARHNGPPSEQKKKQK